MACWLMEFLCSWKDCGIKNKDQLEFLHHVKQHGETSDDYKCYWGTCSTKREGKIGIISHLNVHVPFALHQCSYCLDKFKRVHDLRRHVQDRCRVKKLSKFEKQEFSPAESTKFESQKNIIFTPSTESNHMASSKRSNRNIRSKRIIPPEPVIASRPKRRRAATKTKEAARTILSFGNDKSKVSRSGYTDSTFKTLDSIPSGLLTDHKSSLNLVRSLIEQEVMKLENSF
eukprot:NODE_40_length_29852_cov_0.370215.p11 type:complete len:229 gc:universal NODE_40_length_29852_cov_0.370215:2171-2857(+)